MKKGFTLIELIIVVVIISLVFCAIFTAFGGGEVTGEVRLKLPEISPRWISSSAWRLAIKKEDGTKEVYPTAFKVYQAVKEGETYTFKISGGKIVSIKEETQEAAPSKSPLYEPKDRK